MTVHAQEHTDSFAPESMSFAEPSAKEAAILQDPDVGENEGPKWQHLKIFSAGISYFMAGINDGSLGSLIPYVIRSYAIDTNTISVL